MTACPVLTTSEVEITRRVAGMTLATQGDGRMFGGGTEELRLLAALIGSLAKTYGSFYLSSPQESRLVLFWIRRTLSKARPRNAAIWKMD